jgi:hypothetical protein
LLRGCALAFVGAALIAGDGDESRKHPAEATPQSAPSFEARLEDGGTMKLSVKTPRIELVTPYGKLEIPFSDIRRIDLGWRLSADQLRRIEEAVAELGHDEFDRREAASALLVSLGEMSYAALERGAKSDDQEVAARTGALLEKMRESAPTDRAPRTQYDVVHTAESKIAGRVGADFLRVSTTQFGDLDLRLADVREIRLPVPEELDASNALPDPGTLANFTGQVGKVLVFRVTGSQQQTGRLWGTDVYTMDSELALAAVHAGILKPGQTKSLRVRIHGPTAGFMGSSRNGLTSQSFNSYPAAFEFVKPKG